MFSGRWSFSRSSAAADEPLSLAPPSLPPLPGSAAKSIASADSSLLEDIPVYLSKEEAAGVLGNHLGGILEDREVQIYDAESPLNGNGGMTGKDHKQDATPSSDANSTPGSSGLTSHEYWTKCLEENGVDMDEPLMKQQPRSQYARKSVTSSSSPTHHPWRATKDTKISSSEKHQFQYEHGIQSNGTEETELSSMRSLSYSPSSETDEAGPDTAAMEKADSLSLPSREIGQMKFTANDEDDESLFDCVAPRNTKALEELVLSGIAEEAPFEDCSEDGSTNNAPPKVLKSVPDESYASAYQVWGMKGLLGAAVCKRTTKPTVQIVPEPKATANPPLLTPTVPYTTPRESHFKLDFTGVPSDEKTDKSTNLYMPATRDRMSLPVVRASAAKPKEGRKSFANIMLMWKQKTDDKPNSHFLSPEQHAPTVSSTRDGILSKPVPGSNGSVQSYPTNETSSVTSSSNEARRRHNSVALLYEQRRKETASISDNVSVSSSVASNRSPPVRGKTYETQLQMPARQRLPFDGRVKEQLPEYRRRARCSVDTTTPTSPQARAFQRNMSPGKSRGDYKTVVRSFLQQVDHIQQPILPSGGSGKQNGQAGLVAEVSNAVGVRETQDPLNSRTDPGDAKPSLPRTPRRGDMQSRPTKDIPREISMQSLSPRQRGGSQNTEKKEPPGVTAHQDSPWTKKMVDKVEKARKAVDADDRISPYEGLARDRPWQHDLVIDRVRSFGEQSCATMEEGPCQCCQSVFSGNDELVEFFLPLMGMACTCGKRPMGFINPEEPTSLENILRKWQVTFLAGFGIYRGDQLVKAHHRSANALASALRQYRRKHGMSPFRTKSCGMALQIWSKTSKAYVRSIRKQVTAGAGNELKVPNTLYIISSFLEKMHDMHSPLPRKESEAYISQGEI